jgi:hypothetical protein
MHDACQYYEGPFGTGVANTAAVTGHFQAENVLKDACCTAEIDPRGNNPMTSAFVMEWLVMLMDSANYYLA